jgi:prepilin signal peptidase PulO-like enzyme (type II secretory pathway)
MFEWVLNHQFTAMGVIFMLVIGPAVGNYACSVVYRLPRGKTPFERHPYCGHCNADLKPIDLFPIWSWLSTRGKCRYCAGIIPGIYTVIELVCGVAFIAYFLKFGISETFILTAAYATFVVILAAIQWQQGWIAATIYSYAFALVALIRALSEHTIYGVVQSSVLMLILALIALRLLPKNRTASPFERPWIWWWVLLGALVPLHQWQFLVPLVVTSMLVPKESRLIVYATGALALPLVL